MSFVVDLAKISGSGSFPCPKCGIVLDPDDKSESVYEIKLSPYDEVLLRCKRCGSRIRLTGLGMGRGTRALETLKDVFEKRGIEVKREILKP